MNYRDWLQQLIYKIINPVVHGMIKVGITPNFITTTGLVMNIVAACVFVYAGMYKPGELAYVGWGGGIVLFAGLFDMMDGRVARVGNMSSTFGALYDSVHDRYSEMVTPTTSCMAWISSSISFTYGSFRGSNTSILILLPHFPNTLSADTRRSHQTLHRYAVSPLRISHSQNAAFSVRLAIR